MSIIARGAAPSAPSAPPAALRASAPLLAFALALAAARPSLATDSSFEMGPGGVVVTVRLTERLSSQDAVAGQRFGFETAAPATVDGVRVPAGTRGDGLVAYVRPGRGPVPGRLRLVMSALHLAGGKTIAVGLEQSEAATIDAAGTAPAAGFAIPTRSGAILVGGAGRGNNVVYERGARFTLVAPPPATPEPEVEPS